MFLFTSVKRRLLFPLLASNEMLPHNFSKYKKNGLVMPWSYVCNSPMKHVQIEIIT